MTIRVLYLKASPREERSVSVGVANAFVTELKRLGRADIVDVRDVFALDLPPFDNFSVNAKYAVMRGGNPTGDEVAAWGRVEKIIENFKSYDKYVFAVPMWNFGIPYRLKQYLDIILQPGYTFSFSPEEGYKGLIKGKPAFVSYARGGRYLGDSGAEQMDMQKKYFELALSFIGFENVKSVVSEPTLAGGPELAEEVRLASIEQAKKMAAEF